MNTLLLFDNDGTLIQGFSLHKKAYVAGLLKVYDFNGATIDRSKLNFHGMTDQQILSQLLEMGGFTKDKIDPLLPQCLKVMGEYYEQNVASEKIVALRGVPELLAELNELGISIGLVTGNVEKIAYCKLRQVGLDHYFKSGGFGTDAIIRSDLVKIAIERFEKIKKCKFDRVFVIGDTPKDIQAGQEAGVKTIGVATGIYTIKNLMDAGADYVFADLTDKGRFTMIVTQ